MNKIQNNKLLLRDIKLNPGIVKGLQGCMIMTKNLIEQIFLDNNCLDADDLAHILNGLNYQHPFKSLIVSGSTFDEECSEQVLQLLKRKMPENLEELHLHHAKCNVKATNLLVKNMCGRNYLRKLSLVSAGLTGESFKALIQVVKTSKMLISLDISWNQLLPEHFQELLPILYRNKKLTNINLSWNNIIDVNPTLNPAHEKNEENVLLYLGKIIKLNK